MVDITGAALRLQTVGYNGYAPGRNKPGYCLQWCNLALLQGLSSIGAHAGQYGTAMDAWNYGTQNHPGDTNVPKDFPAYFGPSPTRTDSDRNAGDVVISNGDGRFVCTDGAGGGVVGLMTLAQRAAQISRPYLGWGGEQCGYAMTSSSPSGGGGSTPSAIDEDMMIRIQSPTRGIGLVGAGYYRHLSTSEEVQQSDPLITHHYNGNDRQYDLWVSMALSGSNPTTAGVNTLVARPAASAGSATLTDAQIAAIVAKINAGGPVPTEFTITGKAVAK